ncbi:type II toxin-antitoxin system PemK/MazF family toxin [Paenibacillaceae bacterium WGS1546]|uniref:type II toxin-antitoxin system PemK/MazF family toxin n=1 Tax=Cohnella sp. WGS1546 TaxID=3366810 RepID=UPI00372D1983
MYFAHFPLEEDSSKFLDRPVIIVVAEDPDLVVIKITKTAPRTNDPYDVPIIHYKESGLKFPSTARVSKVITIDRSQLLFKIGKLHKDDLKIVIGKLSSVA